MAGTPAKLPPRTPRLYDALPFSPLATGLGVFSAIVAVGILYSYRGSPFVKDKVCLLYGLGSLFILGLGLRAMYLGTH